QEGLRIGIGLGGFVSDPGDLFLGHAARADECEQFGERVFHGGWSCLKERKDNQARRRVSAFRRAYRVWRGNRVVRRRSLHEPTDRSRGNASKGLILGAGISAMLRILSAFHAQ